MKMAVSSYSFGDYLSKDKLGIHTDIAASKLIDFDLVLTLDKVDMSHLLGGTVGEVLEGHILLESTVHNLEEGSSAELVNGSLEYVQGRSAFSGDLDLVAVCKVFNLLSGDHYNQQNKHQYVE